MFIIPKVRLLVGTASLIAGVLAEVDQATGAHLINEGVAEAAPDQDELQAEPTDPPAAEPVDAPAPVPPPAPVKGAAAKN